MDNVIDLNEKRAPIRYNVHIAHHFGGKIEFWVDDIAEDQRSRESLASALEAIAATLMKPKANNA